MSKKIYLAMAYAQLGRPQKQRSKSLGFLERCPTFQLKHGSITTSIRPGGSAAMLFFDGARKAGLALCATVSDAAQIDPKNRLPECDLGRTGAVQPPT